jgi:cytochrome c biogenesis protein CcdA
MIALISVGVAIPYFALALATGEARNRLAMRISESSRTIELLAGGLLVLVGFLLILPVLGITI